MGRIQQDLRKDIAEADHYLAKIRRNRAQQDESRDTVVYDQATNAFLVKGADSAPKTVFRLDPAKHRYPNNSNYFHAQ